jgi:uncharacterized membrane protein YkvA (DUF1232 family)
LPANARQLLVDPTTQKTKGKHGKRRESASQRPVELLSWELMPKMKSKARATRKKPTSKKVERRISQPKAALRSEAFARALADAKAHANDPERLRTLFEEAARKAAAVPKEPFQDSWPYVQTMLRLVRAYFRGEYRNISQEGLLWIITAMNYFVDPFDLIPDEVPFLGFVDDATVMQFAVARTRQALDDFMTWETTAL